MNKTTIVSYTSDGNSVTFRADEKSPFWITSISGVSGNTVSISETQGVGQTGSTISSQSVQPRDITINGALISEPEINRMAMLACIKPGVFGRLVLSQNDGDWYIEGVPKKTPDFSDGLALQTFQFSLHCAYPYWRSVESQPEQIAGLASLFSFPRLLKDNWYLSKYTASLYTEVTNSGAAPVEFEIVFLALSPVTNPELYHVERKDYIRINKVLSTGEKMIVSTVYGNRGVVYVQTDGTKVNGFRYLDIGSDLSMRLFPGINTLRCAADENREGLLVTISAPKGVRQGL